VDGGLDGISHSLEVLYGAVGKPYYGTMQEIAEVGIGLIMTYLRGLSRILWTPKADRPWPGH